MKIAQTSLYSAVSIAFIYNQGEILFNFESLYIASIASLLACTFSHIGNM